MRSGYPDTAPNTSAPDLDCRESRATVESVGLLDAPSVTVAHPPGDEAAAPANFSHALPFHHSSVVPVLTLQSFTTRDLNALSGVIETAKKVALPPGAFPTGSER